MRRPAKSPRLKYIELEPLEPRQLLTGLPAFPLTSSHAPIYVAGRGGGEVLIGTLRNSHYTIPGDTSPRGPALQAAINWGDSSDGTPTLRRDSKGRIQVWA